MSSEMPRSPGEPDEEQEVEDDAGSEVMEEDPPDAEEQKEEAEDRQEELPGPVPVEKPPIVVCFGKSAFTVNPDHIKFCMNKPYKVPGGNTMASLHLSKSFNSWDVEYGVTPRNIIKIACKGEVGFYILFSVPDKRSSDHLVARVIHKSIAKRFFDQWTKTWGPEKRAKFAELIADEPTQTIAQIEPKFANWQPADNAAELIKNLLYAKDDKAKKSKAAAVPTSPIAKASKKKLVPPGVPPIDTGDGEDDGQSSTAQSAPPSTPMSGALVNFQRAQPSVMAGAPQIFFNTPGQVTISEAWLQHLIANQRP